MIENNLLQGQIGKAIGIYQVIQECTGKVLDLAVIVAKILALLQLCNRHPDMYTVYRDNIVQYHHNKQEGARGKRFAQTM
jgi:hypothetical protein